MGKVTKAVSAFVDKWSHKPTLAERLVEAGLRIMHAEGRIDEDSIIRADFGYETPYRGAFSAAPGSTLHSPDAEKDQVIRFAAELFDSYARHHLAKVEEGPERVEKSMRNIEAAAKCYEALGEDYDAPTFELKPLPTPAEWAIRPDSRPVGADSGLERAGTAKKLLTSLHIAESAGEPTLGVRVHVEDQPIMDTLVEMGFLNRDDVTDRVIVTTKGKDFIGVRPDGVPDLPVEVAEVTGNMLERELSARYVDGKVKGVEVWIGKNPGHASKHDYEIMARVLAEIAYELRMGLHLPTVTLQGRIIPYNEDRTSGLVHADNLQAFFDDVYARNVKAGWWTNIETGEPKKRNVGELFMLMVTELEEAYRSYVLGDMDDKLPHLPGMGVEMGDLLIRIADFCGAVAAGNVIEYDAGSHNPGAAMFAEVCDIAQRYEAIRKTPEAVGDTECGEFIPAMFIGAMVGEKLAFNAKREDHKIENRLKEGGKRT